MTTSKSKKNKTFKSWSTHCVFALTISLLSTVALGDFRSQLVSFTSGMPFLNGNGINPEASVEVEAVQLKGAKLVWADIPLLRELGFDIPETGLTPEMEQNILDELAYIVPSKTIPKVHLGERIKKFFADMYGGSGLGASSGSGRAASSGGIQLKGLGPTSLSETGRDGHEYIEGALKDAFWGEAMTMEMPHGGNRTLFTISTGVVVNTDKGPRVRALNVRINPSRPAQYILPEQGSQVIARQVKKGIAKNLEQLPSVLPKGPFTDLYEKDQTEFLRSGILNLAYKLGQQYGTAYAKRIYHGASSPSNQLIDSGMMDFGTSSYQPAFAHIYTLGHVAPFGHKYLKSIEVQVLNELIAGLKNSKDKRYGGWFRAKNRKKLMAEAAGILEASYNDTVKLEILGLTGTPTQTLQKVSARTRDALAKFLDTLTLVPQELKYSADDALPETAKKNLIRDLFNQVYSSPSINAESLAKIKVEGLSPDRIAAFIKVYLPFYEELAAGYLTEGIRRENLNLYLKYASKTKNQSLYDFYLATLMQKFSKLSSNFEKSGDRQEIELFFAQALDQIKAKAAANDPVEVPIFFRFSNETGITLEYFYNIKTGRYSLKASRSPYLARERNVTVTALKNGTPVGNINLKQSDGEIGSFENHNDLAGITIEVSAEGQEIKRFDLNHHITNSEVTQNRSTNCLRLLEVER